MQEALAKAVAVVLTALITFAALRGADLEGVAVALAALAAGSLYMAFGNALMLFLSKRPLVPFYRGTEMDTREEYMKRPLGSFGNVASPLTLGVFLLFCLHA
ncbi:hypothetical protein [Sphingomonas flavescens]|uniref:hypothetical protein n=1 Tax=Sphingomonas flavescens TaxID=3132797 RepID=UPI002804CA0C|nr:hypothetical protein [Sphingomonas limnosediminicola]